MPGAPSRPAGGKRDVAGRYGPATHWKASNGQSTLVRSYDPGEITVQPKATWSCLMMGTTKPPKGVPLNAAASWFRIGHTMDRIRAATSICAPAAVGPVIAAATEADAAPPATAASAGRWISTKAANTSAKAMTAEATRILNGPPAASPG